MNINLVNACRKQAEDLYQSLANNKVQPSEVVATMQHIDELYACILINLGEHLAEFSDIDAQVFYHNARRSLYSFMDKEYQLNKTYAEMTALSTVINVCPGMFEQFKLYLRDRNDYILRVKHFLHYLNVGVNGHREDHGMLSSHRTPQDSRLDTINEIKRLAKLEKGAGRDLLLDVFAQIQTLINSSELVKSLFSREREFLVGFGFTGQIDRQRVARHL